MLKYTYIIHITIDLYILFEPGAQKGRSPGSGPGHGAHDKALLRERLRVIAATNYFRLSHFDRYRLN